MIVNILKKEETSFPKMPFERTLRHIWPRYHFLNSAYFAYFSVRFQSTEIDCVCVGFSTRANTGVRQTQTADLQTCRLAYLQTCRLADLQTRRPADLQTFRPADLQTGISQLILKTISCNLRRFPVTHLPLRTFKPWTGRAYFPTCF